MEESSGAVPQPVVVGVALGQPDHVLHDAARFATQFDAELICAHVNAGRFAVSEGADGQMTSSPIDPDYHDVREEEFDPTLAAHLATVLDPSGVRWSTRLLVGDTAQALGHLAETVDAAMIVVGTHERGFGGGVQEFFNRSIAVHLAHRQNRPVVVVPARAPGAESPLPWVTP